MNCYFRWWLSNWWYKSRLKVCLWYSWAQFSSFGIGWLWSIIYFIYLSIYLFFLLCWLNCYLSARIPMVKITNCSSLTFSIIIFNRMKFWNMLLFSDIWLADFIPYEQDLESVYKRCFEPDFAFNVNKCLIEFWRKRKLNWIRVSHGQFHLTFLILYLLSIVM